MECSQRGNEIPQNRTVEHVEKVMWAWGEIWTCKTLW